MKSITIQNKSTGEILNFTSLNHCKLYLNVCNDTFRNFLNKHSRRLNREWEIIE